MERQNSDIETFRKDEALAIPTALRFEDINGLSNELKQKLTKIRPSTLGQGVPNRRDDAGGTDAGARL